MSFQPPSRCSHVSTADEALFFYQEHFVDRVYLQHGVGAGLGTAG